VRVRGGSFFACCVLVLSGCSDEAARPSPFTPSPSVSVTPTVDPPAKSAWEKHTRAGAEAFARHWIDVFNDATTTGAVGEFEGLSRSSCETCRRYVNYLESVYGPGGYITTDGWKVLQAVTTEFAANKRRASLSLRVDQSAEVDHFVDPADTKRFPGGKTNWSLYLSWSGAGWRVERWNLVA
jgi:hypothetical protein